MIHVLTQLQAIQFCYQTQRTQAFQILADLHPITDLFDKENRFPIQHHLNIMHSDWPAKLEQIRNSLDYKTPDVSHSNKDLNANPSSHKHNNKNHGNGPSSEHDANTISDMNERDKYEKAEKSYYSGLTNISNQLARGVGVFNQESFESEFAAIWND